MLRKLRAAYNFMRLCGVAWRSLPEWRQTDAAELNRFFQGQTGERLRETLATLDALMAKPVITDPDHRPDVPTDDLAWLEN
jgi:hypothetical protein